MCFHSSISKDRLDNLSGEELKARLFQTLCLQYASVYIWHASSLQ